MFLAIVLPIFVLTFSLIHTNLASAKSCGRVETAIIECGDEESGIGQTLKFIINIMSVGIGILAAIGITVVGIQYLTAGGNEEQTRKSKRRLVEIVIGIIAYVLLYALLQWLIPGSTDPDDIPYYEPVETPVTQETPVTTTPGSSFTETKQCTAKTDKEFITDSNSGIAGYYINIPNGANQNTPIVFYLSGSGETNGFNGQSLETAKSRLMNIASVQYLFSANNFISVIPIGPSSGWPANAIVGLAKGSWGKLNEYLKNCDGIGNRKKYIMGMSLGAQGVWAIVNANPTLFDGASPVSGPTYATPSNFSHTKIVAAVGTYPQGYEDQSRYTIGRFIEQVSTDSRLIIYLDATHDTITRSINYQKLFSCLINNNCSGSFDSSVAKASVYSNKNDGSWQNWCKTNIQNKYKGDC